MREVRKNNGAKDVDTARKYAATGFFPALTAGIIIMRRVLFFIPLLLILPNFLGITGIELSQPLAYVVPAGITAIPFIIAFKNSLRRYERELK